VEGREGKLACRGDAPEAPPQPPEKPFHKGRSPKQIGKEASDEVTEKIPWTKKGKMCGTTGPCREGGEVKENEGRGRGLAGPERTGEGGRSSDTFSGSGCTGG